MSDILVLPNGIQVGTGCLVPEKRPTRFRAFADIAQVLSEQEIREIITDPNRKMGRKRFGKEFIGFQGKRRACNGFAGAKALERRRVICGMDWVKLSGEGLYSQINGGQDQGSMLDDGMNCILENGVPPEDMVKHEEYIKERIDPQAFIEAKRFKGLAAYRVDTKEELDTGLALGFTGVVAVHVTNDFMKLDNNGIIYPSPSNNRAVGNHAVCVDDIQVVDNEFVYDMPNSWGVDYGDDGRGFLTWKRHLYLTVQYHAFYLIRSVEDDYKADNPPELNV